jgi:DNA-binding MarR family transcriptional regulator
VRYVKPEDEGASEWPPAAELETTRKARIIQDDPMKDKTIARRPLSALHLLHRAGQCADELFALNVGKTELTPRQYAVLAAAAASEDLSQTALVDATGIDRSTLADIVRRLVERGLLARRRTKSDARMYAVKLTASGQAAMKAAGPVAESTDSTLLGALPESQRKQFLSALDKIVETMGPISSARVAGRAAPERAPLPPKASVKTKAGTSKPKQRAASVSTAKKFAA